MSESPSLSHFWQEIRRSLMVRGEDWRPVVEDLPNHISAADAKELLQSAEQLTVLQGRGHIAGALIEAAPSKDVIFPFLSNTELTLESITLQWLYSFVVVEALVEHNRKEPLAGWNPMFLHMVTQGLHFMLYMAALLVLIEEGRAREAKSTMENIPVAEFPTTEVRVRERIAQACEFLHPKAQDYGESFRRHGIPGLLPRLWDKISRYVTLKADNRPSNFEKREDSARDLLGYCCIAYSLMLELPKDLRQSYQPIGTFEAEHVGGEWKKVK
jgi:hypothetical protein